MHDLFNSEIRSLALSLGQQHQREAVELAALASVVCGRLQATENMRGIALGPMVTLQSRMVRS